MANPNPTVKYTQLFINNEFVDAVSKKTFPTINPSNGKKIADIAAADQADVDLAVAAARDAFANGSEWRNLDAPARGRLINRLADLLERDIIQLANLESLDNGKTYNDSVSDINNAIDTLRYYAGSADKIQGKTIPVGGDLFSETRLEPVGVVGQIISWNFPILMLTGKWGPALATGCTVILKPAEQTPLTALAVAALAKEAGFPRGVLNVLPGLGENVGAAIALNEEINMLAFNGSTEVGRRVVQAASSNLKRVALQLSGNSPLVILDDADLKEAVEIAYDAIFANQGQRRCAGARTYVQEGIYDQFVKLAVQKANNRKVGDPFASGTLQGPQIDQERLDQVLRLIEAGKKEGAILQTGGKRIGNSGYFLEPTVFSDVVDDMSIAKEEILGPVQVILKFQTLDEVIERANNTNYGLAAGIVTNNINNALQFAKEIQAGTVWVNTYGDFLPQIPFGGYKQSGFGRDLGQDSLQEYLEVKAVTIKFLQ